jgi:hypothetical protein
MAMSNSPPSRLLSVQEQDDVEAYARALLAQQTVDSATREKLAAARARALNAVAARPAHWPWAAAACLILGLTWIGLYTPPTLDHAVDIALVSELGEPEVELELLDDLEFYQWLSELELES